MYKIPFSKTQLNYDWYAYLFADIFSNIEKKKYREIAIATELLAEYAILFDKIMDDQIKNREIEAITLVHNKFRYKKSIEIFYNIFGNNSLFWNYFNKYSKEWDLAILKEKFLHHGSLNIYSECEMEQIAKGKASLAKIVPTSLALLSNSEEIIQPLNDSQDYYAIGLQLHDDLIDWKIDLQKKEYSYMLSKAILENNIAKKNNIYNNLDIDTVGRIIYFSELAENILKKADKYFQKAIDKVEKLSCIDWINYINNTKNKCLNLKQDLKKLRLREIDKLKITKRSTKKEFHKIKSISKEIIEKSIKNAINFILEQQKIDFPEAKHLEFSRVYGKLQMVLGEVFQRTIITDTLIEAQLAGIPINKNTIIEEIEKVISLKLSRNRGGWSYFPSIQSLPPDSDDLGLVLQTLSKTDPIRAHTVCEEVVQLVLKENSNLDGSVDTWIADPEDSNSITAKQDMQEFWGDAPDTEVIANFLYGLYLYDPNKFQKNVIKGVNYLEKKQTYMGYWDSSWYYGPFYGTYVCNRIIKIIKPESNCITKALDFIINSQNNDGGWGEKKSNPLDTSFSLLTIGTLSDVKNQYFKLKKIVNNGLKYLLLSQGEGGNWPATNFIKISLAKDSSQTYKSSTISTAYCLKALIKNINILK